MLLVTIVGVVISLKFTKELQKVKSKMEADFAIIKLFSFITGVRHSELLY